jgi:hypothetical protein
MTKQTRKRIDWLSVIVVMLILILTTALHFANTKNDKLQQENTQLNLELNQTREQCGMNITKSVYSLSTPEGFCQKYNGTYVDNNWGNPDRCDIIINDKASHCYIEKVGDIYAFSILQYGNCEVISK